MGTDDWGTLHPKITFKRKKRRKKKKKKRGSLEIITRRKSRRRECVFLLKNFFFWGNEKITTFGCDGRWIEGKKDLSYRNRIWVWRGKQDPRMFNRRMISFSFLEIAFWFPITLTLAFFHFNGLASSISTSHFPFFKPLQFSPMEWVVLEWTSSTLLTDFDFELGFCWKW